MKFLALRSLYAALLCFGAGHGLAAALPVAIPVFVLAEPDAERAGIPVQPIVPAIIGLLASESGLNLVVRPYPWRRAQMLAERGDGLLYGAAVTPARLRSFRFTSPLGTVNQWLVSASPAPVAFERWEDLRGKRISIMSGGKFSPEFEARRNVQFSVEENASSMTSQISMLRAGRVDAVMVASYLEAAQLEQKLNCLFPGQVPLVVAGSPISAEPIMIAVPRSAPLDNLYPALERAAKTLAGSHAMQVVRAQSASAAICNDAAGPP